MFSIIGLKAGNKIGFIKVVLKLELYNIFKSLLTCAQFGYGSVVFTDFFV